MRRLVRAIVIICALVGGATTGLASQPAQAVVTCEKYATVPIQGGRYNVQNNVWGAAPPSALTPRGRLHDHPGQPQQPDQRRTRGVSVGVFRLSLRQLHQR